jgi:hypothetical protein
LTAESQDENLFEIGLLEGRVMGVCLRLERGIACMEERRLRRTSADPATRFMVRVEPCSALKC